MACNFMVGQAGAGEVRLWAKVTLKLVVPVVDAEMILEGVLGHLLVTDEAGVQGHPTLVLSLTPLGHHVICVQEVGRNNICVHHCRLWVKIRSSCCVHNLRLQVLGERVFYPKVLVRVADRADPLVAQLAPERKRLLVNQFVLFQVFRVEKGLLAD